MTRVISDEDIKIGDETAGTIYFTDIKAGSSSGLNARVGGVLFVTMTSSSNIGTGEDNLVVYTVPADILARIGDSIWFEAFGSFANNSFNKRLRAHFGVAGTSLMIDSGAGFANAAYEWCMRGRIWRQGNTTQRSMITLELSSVDLVSGGGTSVNKITTNLDQTLSGAVDLRITGEATQNNDVIFWCMTVGYDPAKP